MLYDFKAQLKRAGINKSELARRLHITPRAVSAWGLHPPGYAIAYLELLIAYNRYAP